MKKSVLLRIVMILVTFNTYAQTNFVNNASEEWKSLIQLENFDPNDDQQSNADTDFVGNATVTVAQAQEKSKKPSFLSRCAGCHTKK